MHVDTVNSAQKTVSTHTCAIITSAHSVGVVNIGKTQFGKKKYKI